MTGHSRHTANASQSYTFASHTSQHTDQSLQKSMPAQTHGDRKVDERKEQRRHNSTYPKDGVSCSKDSLVVNQSLFLRINICSENRHLRQAPNRYKQT